MGAIAIVTLLLFYRQVRRLPKALPPDAELEQARSWAVDYIRGLYAKHAALVEPHYLPPDLESDLRSLIGTAKTLAQVHERARILAEQIDRFRAYEAVRAAFRTANDSVSGQLSSNALAKKLEALLDPSCTMPEVRRREHELMTHIKRLVAFHRRRADADDDDAEPVQSYEEMVAAIEREVRSEALPEDTEEDIRAEVAHRVRKLKADSSHYLSGGTS
jgi:hypothetical protein